MSDSKEPDQSKIVPPPKKSIFDVKKIKEAYPSLDEKIIELVSSLHIPLNDDFKIKQYLLIQEEDIKKQFLKEQYSLFINFKSMFKSQLSRIFKRDVSKDIDLLISNDILNNETFILANTVNQFNIISSLLKSHDYYLYTHYSEIPQFLLSTKCDLCGAPLITRNGMTDNNLQGSIVSADNNLHLFHFTCISNWIRDLSHCNVCNKSIDKSFFDKMTKNEKELAINGSNFLDGYVGGNRSKKKMNKKRYKSKNIDS